MKNINRVHERIKNFHFTKFKLKIHYDFVHEGIRHFKCTKCEEVGENKSFGTPGGLQDHIKILFGFEKQTENIPNSINCSITIKTLFLYFFIFFQKD